MRAPRPIIVVDSGIPGVVDALGDFGDIRAEPAERIARQSLAGAEILVVRSVTRVDAALLDGTPVRFVGTATAGFDHVDRVYLRSRGIRFARAAGANAESVGDWALAALLRLCSRHSRPVFGLRVGIVGCGQVGSRLGRRLLRLGVRVLVNDPPRQARAESHGRAHGFESLDRLLAQSDVVSLHVPLQDGGRFPTRGLLSGSALARMRPGAWVLNTSRGEVMDPDALLEAVGGGLSAALDVWPGEPRPDPRLVAAAEIATAHVAGYALDSKRKATERMRLAVGRFVRGERPDAGTTPVPHGPPVRPGPSRRPAESDTEWLDRLVASVWDIERDDLTLRRAVDAGAGPAFEAARRGYPGRRLFSTCTVDRSVVPVRLAEAVFGGLRFARPRR